MSKLNTADLLSQFKDMSLVELTEFVKAFETEFDVTAAAPVAVAAAGGAAGGAADAGQQAAADDTVTDVDFEEVKEDDKK